MRLAEQKLKQRIQQHVPVLLEESIAGLRIRPAGQYIDATLGGGGHAEAILKRLSPGCGGRLLGIDRDRSALEKAGERLKHYGGCFIGAQGNFKNIEEIARAEGWSEVDGILMDLGFSSKQIDEPDRGFSFRHPARLDMRMNTEQSPTAFDVVNGYSREELRRIFRTLGEERKAGKIAGAIVESRKRKTIETTTELAEIVAAVYGRTGGRIHPATKVFQALRIHVNSELENLAVALPLAVDLLRPLGKLAVISYHSLEDRVVKDAFNYMSGKCVCPSGHPVCSCGTVRRLSIINRRPIRPTQAEVSANRRARSAKLRLAEKLGANK